MAGGITIANRDDFSRALDGELNPVVGSRHKQPFFVGRLNPDKRKIVAVGRDCGAVGHKVDLGRFTGRFNSRFCPAIAPLISDDFKFTWLVYDIVQRKRYSNSPFFLRPSDFPLRNNSPQDLNLAFDGPRVDGRTQRSEVVVLADSVHPDQLSV